MSYFVALQDVDINVRNPGSLNSGGCVCVLTHAHSG